MKISRRLIFSAILYLVASYGWLDSIDHSNIVTRLGNGILTILSVITFILIFLGEMGDYRRTKHFMSFSASIPGLVILVSFISVLMILDRRDKSPSILYCVSKYNDFNGVSIDFREDGSFKLTKWMMGDDIFRGKYTIRDSIISLDSQILKDELSSFRFVIRTENEIDEKGIRKQSLYPVDSSGIVIDNATQFSVRTKAN